MDNNVKATSGFNCMKSILYKIGFKMEFVLEDKNQLVYTLKTK